MLAEEAGTPRAGADGGDEGANAVGWASPVLAGGGSLRVQPSPTSAARTLAKAKADVVMSRGAIKKRAAPPAVTWARSCRRPRSPRRATRPEGRPGRRPAARSR